MLVPNQILEVTLNPKNIKHYESLGYSGCCGNKILVPPEHLPHQSHTKVQVSCDICGKVYEKSFDSYNKSHTYDMDVCLEHRKYKTKITNMNKYGVPWTFQDNEIKNKIRNTNIEKYGTKTPFESEIIQNKITQTNIEKYGCPTPSSTQTVKDKVKKTVLDKYGVEAFTQSEQFKEKSKATCLKKYGDELFVRSDYMKEYKKEKWLREYGVSHYFQTDEYKDKYKQTCLERYGVKNVFQSPQIKEKIRETLYKNGTTPTSQQQIQLHKMIQKKYPNAELNYPFSSCSLDIFVCVDDIKIDVEYDGWYWHQDKHKDLKRDKFLQSQGFKVIRIRSGTQLPTEQELFDTIDYLVNTEHHFKEIILSDWKECDE